MGVHAVTGTGLGICDARGRSEWEGYLVIVHDKVRGLLIEECDHNYRRVHEYIRKFKTSLFFQK